MSKLLTTPVSRLICFGGAKTCTNAVTSLDPVEDNISLGFGE
jgi:hypothetical protein